MTVPAILLVEDSADDLYFFQRKLKKLGSPCTFRHLADGAAAVQYLLEQARSGTLPDLIFLDLKMPVMSGFEVLEWLHHQSFAWTPPVVVLSGSGEEGDRRRAAALGVAGYLVKPVSAEDLAAHIAAATARLAGTQASSEPA